MCDERERLIAYVYGEAAASERQQIETHLGDCHVCRAEVSGLRSVRDDLLAWEVPKHEPIWRPSAPASAAPARATWSGWALATAASALFAAGLVGGMAVRGWTSDASPTVVAGSAAANPQPQAVSTVTSEELARMEAAILQRLRNELTEQLRVSTPAASPSSAGLARAAASNRPDDTGARLAAIERRLDDQDQWRDDQISLNAIFNGQVGRLNRSTSNLSERFELSRMQTVGLDGGSR
jgi:anti-sigma factor RsiW